MTERLGDWARSPAVRDAALAVVLLVVSVLVNGALWDNDLPPGDDVGDHAVPWWTATVLAVAAVALRRRWPVAMTAVVAATVTAHVLLPTPIALVDLSLLVLLGTVAVRCGRSTSLAVLGCLVVLATGWSVANALAVRQVPQAPEPRPAPEVFRPSPEPPRPGPERAPRPDPVFLPQDDAWDTSRGELTVFVSALVAAWAVGSGTRSRRAHLEELRARARELERDRDLQAAFAVAAERGRISRELHDVVAHGLSVMVIQAQGGAAALDNRPADTRSALDAIVRTGRESLADMRRVLAAVGEVDDTWHPQPGLAQLTALVAQVREAGTPVELRVEGTAGPLPSTVDLSAYRIVQEALTNTMKHAGKGAKADVVLSYRQTGIDISVSDDGRGAVGEAEGGNGVRGMRERARLLGGSLVAEPGPGGGFVVRAALPIRGSGS